MKKRVFSFFLALLMVVTIVPITKAEAASSPSYDATKALTYAKAHWNDGKGLCAEFVADCLRAGGLSVPSGTVWTHQIVELLINTYGFKRTPLIGTSGPKGNWNSFFISNNQGRYNPGDVICYVPIGEQETNTNPVHVVLAGEATGTRITAYAHNIALNNVPIDQYSDNTDWTKSGSYSCFVINLSNGTTPSTPSTPSASMTPEQYLALSSVKTAYIKAYVSPKNGSANTWKLPWTDNSNASLRLGTISGEVLLKNKITNHAGNVWYEYDTGSSTRGFVYSGDVDFTPVSSVSMNLSSKTLKVGATTQLTATVAPSNASNQTVLWKSSNDSVATVSSSGLVTAKAAGTATITATARDGSGRKATATITVNEVKVTGITVSPTSKTMNIDATAQLTATVSPSNATNKAVTWSSSNTAVASVSSGGLVTAKAVGTATITATAKDGSGKTATSTIKVTCSHKSFVNGACSGCGIKAAAITQQPTSVTVAKGAMATVSVKASGDGLTYRWYFKDKGSSSFNYTSTFTGNTYSVSMTDARNGRQVYCRVYDKYGNMVQSNTATLTMGVVKITQQPTSVTVAKGAMATVSVKASGDGLTYRWYYKNKGSSSFIYTSTFTGNTYSVSMTDARNGRQVYCRVYDKYGNVVQSNTVLLSMK